MDFSAVILAGGKSSRMGRNKAWLEYRGRPLLIHQIETVRACHPAQISLSAASPAHFNELGWPVLANPNPNLNPNPNPSDFNGLGWPVLANPNPNLNPNPNPSDFSALGWPVLADNFPGSGPLGGIERALETVESAFLLVLAVDMPFMTADTLKRLAERCEPGRGVVPRVAGQVQPLAAFYPKAAHGTLLRLLGEGLNSAVHFAETCVALGLARYSELGESHKNEFANWNTPEDVARLGSR